MRVSQLVYPRLRVVDFGRYRRPVVCPECGRVVQATIYGVTWLHRPCGRRVRSFSGVWY